MNQKIQNLKIKILIISFNILIYHLFFKMIIYDILLIKLYLFDKVEFINESFPLTKK